MSAMRVALIIFRISIRNSRSIQVRVRHNTATVLKLYTRVSETTLLMQSTNSFGISSLRNREQKNASGMEASAML